MEIFGLGAPELLIILFLLLLFFGKDKLPELANSIGRSVKELKNGFKDGVDDKDTASKKDGGTKSGK